MWGNPTGGSDLEKTYSTDRFIPPGINEIFYTQEVLRSTRQKLVTWTNKVSRVS